MGHVLIVDENRQYCDRLHEVVQKKGYQLSRAHSLQEGFKVTSRENVDVVLLTNQFTHGNGAEYLQELRNNPTAPEVIILAENVNADEAENAIKNGAWDYMAKSAPTKIITPLSSIMQYRRKRVANREALSRKEMRSAGIVGKSSRLKACVEMLNQAAASDANVLLSGETGTGKELFASALHKFSRRSGENFVVVDCAALPESLVESTLFGHERGAFTGAVKSQTGLIKQADGGTLFLDEVGELPLSLQKSFLRVLEERRFRPVGASRESSSDFRLIAATNQDLDALVEQGKFRKDLLFRLRTFNIILPPLKERSEDVLEIARYFFTRLQRRVGGTKKKLSEDFCLALRHYPWPGNVRELFHALERAAAAAEDDPMLFPKHLPTYIRIHLARNSLSREKPGCPREDERMGQEEDGQSQLPKLQEVRTRVIERAEKQYLQNLVRRTEGNIREACEISGLSRSRLYQLLKDYRIETPS